MKGKMRRGCQGSGKRIHALYEIEIITTVPPLHALILAVENAAYPPALF